MYKQLKFLFIMDPLSMISIKICCSEDTLIIVLSINLWLGTFSLTYGKAVHDQQEMA